MILDFLITLLTVFLFLFIFWLRLKDDYTQNQIFTTGFYVLLGIGIGNILAIKFMRDFWFWLGFFGGFLGLIYGVSHFRLRFFEALESYTISGLFLFLIVSFISYLEDLSSSTLIVILLVLFFISFFYFLDSRYKNFTWYKSGKVGFSGLTILGLFFLTRSLVAIRTVSVISFGKDVEVLLSGLLSFISFIILYNLSERT